MKDAIYQSIGGLIAVAIAWGGVTWWRHLAGDAGILALIVSVPLGVVSGWLLIKLLYFAERVLGETE
jgi:hypothetical protein